MVLVKREYFEIPLEIAWRRKDVTTAIQDGIENNVPSTANVINVIERNMNDERYQISVYYTEPKEVDYYSLVEQLLDVLSVGGRTLEETKSTMAMVLRDEIEG